MKDFAWFLVQMLVLEISLILIRIWWILKHSGQRKDLNMSPGKSPSCLPHEKIKDDNLSRVWQLYSLKQICSYASITWINVFCLQDDSDLFCNKYPHVHDHTKTGTRRWGKRHFLLLWNFSEVNDSFFSQPLCQVLCCTCEDMNAK